jgi:multicomponent K+:H+ antiporter subunit D
MSHLPVLPVLVPLLAGALLVLLARAPLALRRALGLGANLLQLGLCLALLAAAARGEVAVYLLGNWPAWAGIALMVDRLAALMLVLTAVLALGAQLYACGGQDRRGAHFHALFQFQLAGLSGAFLTADLFNLFVFFEVLLISSYGLLLHGDGGLRLKRSLHYVAFNLVASALFLVAVALLYGVLGTLNMADLAGRIAASPAADATLVRSAGLLLLVVFCAKAALLPLYLWLPGAYASATAPVAALFAVMTKVGVYAVVRVHGLLFGADAGAAADLAWPWLLPAGLATLGLASLGALAATSLRRLVAYLVVASAGTLFIAVGSAGEAALGAALYYLVHSTLVAAVLFLLADRVRRARGEAGDSLRSVGPMAGRGRLGLAFLVGAMAAGALPPWSGFLAKALLLDALGAHPAAAWIWTVVLASGLLVILALARAGAHLFWREPADAQPVAAPPTRAMERLATAMLLSVLVALAVFAEPAARYARDTAAQLRSPATLAAAVLATEPRTRAGTSP